MSENTRRALGWLALLAGAAFAVGAVVCLANGLKAYAAVSLVLAILCFKGKQDLDRPRRHRS